MARAADAPRIAAKRPPPNRCLISEQVHALAGPSRWSIDLRAVARRSALFEVRTPEHDADKSGDPVWVDWVVGHHAAVDHGTDQRQRR